MSNAPEEFEDLRTLLKLKRYEQPPPRFFPEFSTRVINGIEARQASAGFLGEVPLLGRFFRMLEGNALAAGAFVTGICALLIGGVVYSELGGDSPSTVAVAGAEGITPAQETASLVFADRQTSTDPVFGSSSNVFPQNAISRIRFEVPQ